MGTSKVSDIGSPPSPFVHRIGLDKELLSLRRAVFLHTLDLILNMIIEKIIHDKKKRDRIIQKMRVQGASA